MAKRTTHKVRLLTPNEIAALGYQMPVLDGTSCYRTRGDSGRPFMCTSTGSGTERTYSSLQSLKLTEDELNRFKDLDFFLVDGEYSHRTRELIKHKDIDMEASAKTSVEDSTKETKADADAKAKADQVKADKVKADADADAEAKAKADADAKAKVDAETQTDTKTNEATDKTVLSD